MNRWSLACVLFLAACSSNRGTSAASVPGPASPPASSGDAINPAAVDHVTAAGGVSRLVLADVGNGMTLEVHDGYLYWYDTWLFRANLSGPKAPDGSLLPETKELISRSVYGLSRVTFWGDLAYWCGVRPAGFAVYEWSLETGEEKALPLPDGFACDKLAVSDSYVFAASRSCRSIARMDRQTHEVEVTEVHQGGSDQGVPIPIADDNNVYCGSDQTPHLWMVPADFSKSAELIYDAAETHPGSTVRTALMDAENVYWFHETPFQLFATPRGTKDRALLIEIAGRPFSRMRWLDDRRIVWLLQNRVRSLNLETSEFLEFTDVELRRRVSNEERTPDTIEWTPTNALAVDAENLYWVRISDRGHDVMALPRSTLGI